MKRIILVSWLLFPAAANAVAATSEDLLCHSSNIVLAKVVGATALPCGPNIMSTSNCEKRPVVPLTIEVTRIIASQNDNPNYVPIDVAISDRMYVSVSADNVHPEFAAGMMVNPRSDYGNINMERPTEKAVTQEQVEKTFVGKEFIFAIMQHKGTLPSGDSLSSFMWKPQLESWVEETLQLAAATNINPPYCPKLVQ